MSTILFYESNRLSLWHGGAAQPLLVLLGESDERSQAIAPAVSERDRGWFGRLEHHDRQFSRTYTRAIRQPRSGKNIAASQSARGSGHLCLLLGWGSAVWRETEEGKKTIQIEVKRRREQDSERDSSKGANRASECYCYVLFIYSYVLFTWLLQRRAQLRGRQTARGKTCGRRRLRQRGCTHTQQANRRTDDLFRKWCAEWAPFINI